MSESNSSDYLQALFGLSGKTAVVIGGTGVLGGAIADALAQAGAHVVIVGRNAENGDSRVKQIEALKGSAEFFAADSTSRSDLEALVAHLKDNGKVADILVNGAGINAATPFLEISDEEWERIFRVNLLSVKVACQVFGQAMLEAKVAGSIINIASMSAITPLSRVFT
ncbi:MAG: SDR family NAD(P)-dependent oxidoreductase, partial [Planctomycetaceae bacterium]|nr:SDR family NAD(P)-dependent oxidoreductase [Planctomycetaceae bacterium]